MKTFLPKVTEIKRNWVEIDASKHTLGRLATQVANSLRGKNKPIYTPHMDVGDYVVVINAKNVKLTGRKLIQKEYIRFTGYPGGIRKKKLRDFLAQSPDRVIRHAVIRMLAPTRLRQRIMRRLRVVDENKHTFKIDKRLT